MKLSIYVSTILIYSLSRILVFSSILFIIFILVILGFYDNFKESSVKYGKILAKFIKESIFSIPLFSKYNLSLYTLSDYIL